MASTRQSPPAEPTRLPSMSNSPTILPDLPLISALFLINFDVKAGYTIVWKQQLAGVDIEGVVEYKSLPSGLHTVQDDLVYFVHDDHAGLGAFINMPCQEEELRHARMISVGVLVPLSYGRLGRVWRHAESLKDMAETLARDAKHTSLLEAYWEHNKASETASMDASDAQLSYTTHGSSLASSGLSSRHLPAKTHGRNRSASDGATLIRPGHKLSSFHPAWSLMSLLETFGPLIFPIHRAALLRKRILISCHAPVHKMCNFVYDISVLSNIPLATSEILPSAISAHRLRPLFAIGVHDIPFLQEDRAAAQNHTDSSLPNYDEKAGEGWIACTTDSILAMKDTLWDMLITMPSPHVVPTGGFNLEKDRTWPQVECPAGVLIKATQRDLRRFRSLKLGLARIEGSRSIPTTPHTPSSLFMSPAEAHWEAVGLPPDAADKIVEPATWTALAYNGFMWWASAGEQALSDQTDEIVHDSALLTDLVRSQPGPHPQPTVTLSAPVPSPGVFTRFDDCESTATTTARPPLHPHISATPSAMIDSISSLTARRLSIEAHGQDEEAARELALIAYFHRLTASMFRILADLNETAAAEDVRDEYAYFVDGDEESDLLLPGIDGDREMTSGAVAGEEGGGEDEVDKLKIRIDAHAMTAMGLDVWSTHDAAFLEELVKRYFGRGTVVEGKGIEVCGIKVC